MAILPVISVVLFLSLAAVAVLLKGSHAQDQCVCSYGPPAWIQVCGNDGKSYTTVCDLVTAQKTNPSLGARCLGQCPCRVLNNPFTGSPAVCPRPFQNPYFNGFGNGGGFGGHGNGGHSGYGHHGGRGGHGNDGRFGRSINNRMRRAVPEPEKTDRHFIGGGFGYGYGGGFAYAMFAEPRVCLTNGQDVSGLQSARCAIAKDKTSTLGIRCLGSCRFCKANPVCPVAQFPSVTVTPPPSDSTDITLPPVIGSDTTTVPIVAPPTAVTAPPPLPDFLAAINKIFE